MRGVGRASLIVFLVLVAAGCGSQKMSARHLEGILLRGHAPGLQIRCRPGAGRWDYDCTFSGRAITGSRKDNTYGFDVNDKRVTSQSG